ncbi:DUF805 domain-containing protein [Candidatus Pelagibacter sp.]|nr:DUF805 domain-containing protein [Candidatus Pelagibacter sp.]
MTFGESVSTCFEKYFVFQGRASKSEFWWFQLIWVVSYLLILISNNQTISFICLGIIIIIAIPLLSVGVRRLHDTNKSGYYYLFSLIPFIGGLIVLFMMIGDGTKGKNRYGPDPLKKVTKKRSKKK